MDLAQDIIHYLNQGGAVMIPLIISSLIMWTLILDRLIFFSRLEKKDLALYRLVTILKQRKKPVKTRGVRAFLVNHLMMNRTYDPLIDKRIVEQCAMSLYRRFDHYLAVIAILAAVSPLFGLLGTVTGMITTFDVITLFGTGNAKAMAGGISEALVTTQSGLMVSIPGLFMSVFLYRQSSRAKARLKEAVMILKRSLK